MLWPILYLASYFLILGQPRKEEQSGMPDEAAVSPDSGEAFSYRAMSPSEGEPGG